MRYGVLVGTGPGQDLRLYPEKLESCRRFANKLWNAGRYIYELTRAYSGDTSIKGEETPPDGCYIKFDTLLVIPKGCWSNTDSPMRLINCNIRTVL